MRCRNAAFTILFLACSSVSGVAAEDVPADFPRVAVDFRSDPAPGYVFLSNFALDRSVDYVPYLMVLDNSGYPVRYRKLTTPINMDFKLQPDGTLTYCDAVQWFVLDANLNRIDSLRAGNGWNTDGHELRILSNGNRLVLAWRERRVDMTVYGGRRNAIVQDCAIQELDPSDAVLWQWDTASHFEIDDATRDIDLTAAYIDYVHCNAVEIDTDGNLLLSSRHFDEITKIDRTTGAILWRLGGKECENNQFRFVDDFVVDQGDTLFWGFSHQHGIRRTASGHILLFDNGNLKDPPYSRAVEYELDEENRVATRVWEYRRSPDVVSNEMGFAQRLDNGNTLVGWGGNAVAVAMTEVGPDGSPRVEMTLPSANFSYRAFRFVFAMAAVTRAVAGPGRYEFDAPGNVTSVDVEIREVQGSGSMTLQRHDYTAHELAFEGGASPGQVYPYRWVVTQDGLSGLDATVHFDAAALPALANPERAVAYWRTREGQGEFAAVPTTYDLESGDLRALIAAPGELILAVDVVAGSGSEPTPAALELAPASPNPFSRSTVLRYRLARSGPVDLRVFDAAGRQVAVLVDAERPAGIHEVTLEGSHLGSGVYFCRLESGDRIETTKIVLQQ